MPTYESLFAAGPMFPADTFPYVVTPGGQIVNVGFTSPVQFWLNGGATLLPLPLAEPLALHFNVDATGTPVSVQQ